MAFDFPDAPTVGDEFVSGGCKYTWTGLVWDLSGMDAALDYVQTTGDNMSGTLNFDARSASAHAITIQNDDTAAVTHTMKLSGSSSTHSGLIEFFGNDGVRRGYVGYGDNSNLNLIAEGGRGWLVSGNMQLNTGCLAFTNFAQPAGSEHLLTRHINMYGGTFGFSISSGTLNHVVPAANIHAFKCGTETVADIRSDGLRIPGGNLSVTGTISASGMISSTVAQGNTGLQLSDGVKIDFSSGCQIRKVYGSNQFQFHTNASQVFAFHISNTGDVFVIDTVGSTGNSVNVTAPESLALAKELNVGCDKDRGADVMKVMAAMLIKIKKLEAEVTALKARK